MVQDGSTEFRSQGQETGFLAPIYGCDAGIWLRNPVSNLVEGTRNRVSHRYCTCVLGPETAFLPRIREKNRRKNAIGVCSGHPIAWFKNSNGKLVPEIGLRIDFPQFDRVIKAAAD